MQLKEDNENVQAFGKDTEKTYILGLDQRKKSKLPL